MGFFVNLSYHLVITMTLTQRKIELINWIQSVEDESLIEGLEKFKQVSSTQNMNPSFILDGLKEAIQEVKSHQEGKTELKSLQEFLDEL